MGAGADGGLPKSAFGMGAAVGAGGPAGTSMPGMRMVGATAGRLASEVGRGSGAAGRGAGAVGRASEALASAGFDSAAGARGIGAALAGRGPSIGVTVSGGMSMPGMRMSGLPSGEGTGLAGVDAADASPLALVAISFASSAMRSSELSGSPDIYAAPLPWPAAPLCCWSPARHASFPGQFTHQCARIMKAHLEPKRPILQGHWPAPGAVHPQLRVLQA